MFFYILPGPYRVGFGITSDYQRRAKDYTGAWGGVAKFSWVFQGPTPHVKRLESLIKIQHRDMLWKLDDWETEWLDNGWNSQQLYDFVQDIIAQRRMPISVVLEPQYPNS